MSQSAPLSGLHLAGRLGCILELGWAQVAGQPGKTSGLGPQGSPFGGLEWLENLLEKALFSF